MGGLILAIWAVRRCSVNEHLQCISPTFSENTHGKPVGIFETVLEPANRVQVDITWTTPYIVFPVIIATFGTVVDHGEQVLPLHYLVRRDNPVRRIIHGAFVVLIAIDPGKPSLRWV